MTKETHLIDNSFRKKTISQARACAPSPNCSQSRGGGWGSWSPWSACPVTCGQSMVQRTRPCRGGDHCNGAKVETSPCNKAPCMSFRSLQVSKDKTNKMFPQKGKKDHQAAQDHLWSWGGWGEWAACTKSCGTGLTWRKRTCGRGQCSLAPVGVREVKTCYLSGSDQFIIVPLWYNVMFLLV